MSKIKIIGFAGSAGVGKDTIAELLKKHNPEIEICSFAEPVYRLVSSIFNIPIEVLKDRKTKEVNNWVSWSEETLVNTRKEWDNLLLNQYGSFDYYWEIFRDNTLNGEKRIHTSYRRLLQWLGTEFGRQLILDNVWVDLLFYKIKKSGFKEVVITDARFANEYEAIKEKGGSIVEITSKNSAFGTELVDHPSAEKISYVYVDYVFENNFDGLDKLETDVVSFYDNIYKAV